MRKTLYTPRRVARGYCPRAVENEDVYHSWSVFYRRNGAGHAIIELALIGLLVFLLFAVILNFGMFMYTGISVANAARAAALETGAGSGIALDQTLACNIVRAGA